MAAEPCQGPVASLVGLRVTMPDPRCVMTTLGQEELPTDGDVLRTLVRHNRVEIEGAGRFPCAGVYVALA